MVFDTQVGDADLVVVRLCGEDGVAKREGVVRQTTGAHLAHSEGLPDVGCRSQSLAMRAARLGVKASQFGMRSNRASGSKYIQIQKLEFSGSAYHRIHSFPCAVISLT